MTYIGRLYEGSMLVRLIPLVHLERPVWEIATPRMTPPRLVDLDPEPTIGVDEWRWTGSERKGWVTVEFWEATFGTAPPADTAKADLLVPVRWLDYRRGEGCGSR